MNDLVTFGRFPTHLIQLTANNNRRDIRGERLCLGQEKSIPDFLQLFLDMALKFTYLKKLIFWPLEWEIALKKFLPIFYFFRKNISKNQKERTFN